MKRQLFAIVAGSLLLVSPVISKAVMAQTTPAPMKTERSGEWQQLKQSLNLSTDQQATLKQIRQKSRTDMEAVLTDAQKNQLAAEKAAYKANRASGKKDGKKGHHGWKSLNLTDAQKAKIKSIREEAKAQADAVYTPAQQETLKQFRANHPHKQKAHT